MHPLILTVVATLGLLAGCGGSRPASADSARYDTDSVACDKSISDAVNKRDAKKALTWFASSVTRWSEIDAGVTTCMQAKGYGTVRPCTEEERRNGNATASLVVTARGIICKDAGRPG